ncbi:MAG: hypothetical protein DWQ10_09925 [Calditrichaeota bacterium]|nr:MAG: hypothetical protein DWQ10_09925 [Calditrichota bacterium]
MKYSKTSVRLFILGFLVTLLYGAGLKMFPLEFDEIRFVREVELPFWEYLKLASHDNSNTPVMHAINWIISHSWGAEIWHLRFFSFLFMAGSIFYFF